MARYKAVVIDDEVWTREVIKSLGNWEGLNIEVVGEASDGEYGLELVRRMGPDIIVTDVRMPHLNGIDLVGLLRREHNDACVLIISGYDDFAYIRSALQLGVTDYLLKPIKAEELNAQLCRCTETLDRRAAREKEEVGLATDFTGEAWAEGYIAQQDELREALRARSTKRIEARFQALGELVTAHETGRPPKSVIIGIYYTMENLLRRFIVDSGYTVEQIYGKQGNTFLFSGDTGLDDMLDFLCVLYCSAAKRVEALQRARGKLDVEQIRRYAADHCIEGVTLEQTAGRFYVSMEYLSKVFKTTYGEGFTEYVTRLRMEKAMELLRSGSLPLKDVGAAVGYCDQAHFYKTFKRIFGKRQGQCLEKEADMVKNLQ